MTGSEDIQHPSWCRQDEQCTIGDGHRGGHGGPDAVVEYPAGAVQVEITQRVDETGPMVTIEDWLNGRQIQHSGALRLSLETTRELREALGEILAEFDSGRAAPGVRS